MSIFFASLKPDLFHIGFLFIALPFYRKPTAGNSWFVVCCNTTEITSNLQATLLKNGSWATNMEMSCWKPRGMNQK